LGKALHAVGQVEPAINALKAGIDSRDGFVALSPVVQAAAYAEFGHVLREGGQLLPAIAAYKTAQEHAGFRALPADIQAAMHVGLAHALREDGKYQPAMDAYGEGMGHGGFGEIPIAQSVEAYVGLAKAKVGSIFESVRSWFRKLPSQQPQVHGYHHQPRREHSSQSMPLGAPRVPPQGRYRHR
jgi:tetratricopeptide (TPR) repeat protein